jgi:hypothetical protein
MKRFALLVLFLAATSSVALAQWAAVLGASRAASGVYVLKDQGTTNNDFDQFGDNAARLYLSSSWTAGSSYTIRRVVVLLYTAGSPTFDVQVQIQGDSAGAPSGTALCTSTTTINAATLTGTATAYNFDFAVGTAITSGTKYHIVTTSSTLGDASNYVKVRINYAGATGQDLYSWNGSGWSPRYSNTQYVFETWAIE